MKPVVDIGLPDLDEEQIDALAEACEKQITSFILNEIPSKSIDELSISCTLDLDDELHLAIDIDIIQKYSTGQNLEEITNRASEYASDWLERQLKEMK
ncbi:MAG: DUF3194 domain-containing protein [Candidatus Thorarchaeota archaeon]